MRTAHNYKVTSLSSRHSYPGHPPTKATTIGPMSIFRFSNPDVSSELQGDIFRFSNPDVSSELQGDIFRFSNPDVSSELQGDMNPDVSSELQGDMNPDVSSELQGDMNPDVSSELQGDMNKFSAHSANIKTNMYKNMVHVLAKHQLPWVTSVAVEMVSSMGLN